MTKWLNEWYQCKDCSYGTNSVILANRHERVEGHTVVVDNGDQ